MSFMAWTVAAAIGRLSQWFWGVIIGGCGH
jgi:hypothetical protein